MQAPTRWSRLVLPLVYLMAGLAWVVGSDTWTHRGSQGHADAGVGMFMGVVFVAFSAVLLYVAQSWRARTAPNELAGNLPWRARLVFLACALGVFALGYGVYRAQVEQVRERAEAELANAAALTARQIELWVADRHGSLEHAAGNAMLADAVRRVRGGEADATSLLHAVLEHILRSDNYRGLGVVGPGGASLFATGQPIPWTPQLERQAEEARRAVGSVVPKLYVPDGVAEGRPVLDLVIALADTAPAGEQSVVLVARADPERFLYPALRSSGTSRTQPSYGMTRLDDTGATVLMYADPSDMQPGAVRMTRTRVGLAATEVARGRTGTFEAADHAGVPTLATGHRIEGTPWHVIAELPLAEVYAPLLRVGRIALLLAVGGLALAAALITLWWRRESAVLASRLDDAEERARRLRQHFAVAGRLVQDVVLLLDSETGAIIEANDRATEAYGYTREELLRMSVADLRRTDAVEMRATLQKLNELVRAGQGTFNVQHYRKDGSPLPLELSARMLTVGSRTYVQTVGRDISERLEHERRVAAIAAERDDLLERMQLQFKRMGSACMVVAPDGRLLQVNPAFEDTFGYPADAVIGTPIDVLIRDTAFREEALSRLAGLMVDPEVSYSGVHENLTARGKAIVCRWTAAAMRDRNGTVCGFIAMADDITDLVKAERALRASEARYRALTEDSPVGIFRTDVAGNIRFLNRRAQAITGYDPRSVVPDGWVPKLHPDDAQRVDQAWREYLAGNRGPSLEAEFRLTHGDEQMVWVLAQSMPERDAEGRIVGHFGTITDVTAIKQAQLELEQAHHLLEQRVRERTQELEAAKDAAVRSDRVKTAFLSTVSHELRTPLNSIMGFTEVLLQGLAGPLNEDQMRQLRIVRDSSTHLRALVEDVLDISRIEAGQIALEFENVDLRELLERKLAAFAPEALRKGIGFEFRADDAPLWLHSDSRRLAQIVSNLVSNALKFTDVGRVTTALQVANDRIEILVEDTGVGIPPDALGQIFDPFQQVARPGGRLRDGAGLGLAIARNLARALGGDIEVVSEVERGSRFTFWLPATARIAAPTRAPDGDMDGFETVAAEA